MKIKTADGRDIETNTLIINDNPRRISIRIANMTIQEAVNMFSEDGVLPLEGYKDFTEVASVNKVGQTDTMVSLVPQSE